MKASKAELQPNIYSHNYLNRFTLQDSATTCTYTKAKEQPPSQARVADRSVDQMYVEPG